MSTPGLTDAEAVGILALEWDARAVLVIVVGLGIVALVMGLTAPEGCPASVAILRPELCGDRP